MVMRLMATILGAPKVMFAKNWIRREPLPFDLELDVYSQDDYEKIVPVLKEIESALLRVPPDREGMRWIHQMNTVFFYVEKTFDMAYDGFVARVDISHVGDFYRDSISVDTVVASENESGQAQCQGVRIVALPQPNYAAFMGKENLDVYKLEKIDYTPDERRVSMRTVLSPNGSAVCDDGYMAFRRSSGGEKTTVAFLACQHFPIPPLMALVGLNHWTWLKNRLTEMAYRRFSDAMMSNIAERYHGADFRIGRPLSIVE